MTTDFSMIKWLLHIGNAATVNTLGVDYIMDATIISSTVCKQNPAMRGQFVT